MTVKVMLIDDSTVIRGLLRRVLTQDRQIEVIGQAGNGKLGIDLAPRLRPDVIILDIEMPEMNGLQTLPHLKRLLPRTAVIMFSTLTEAGAGSTLEALERGADDYVTKPSNTGSFAETAKQIHANLVPKIKALGTRRHAPPPRPAPRKLAQHRRPAPRAGAVPRPSSRRTKPPRLVVVGVSTGGPNALAKVIPALPKDLGVPVLVTQHMPPLFTRLLAERLDEHAAVSVAEGIAGVEAKPGSVWFAPGGKHMVVRNSSGGRVMLGLTDSPPIKSCKPAVDVLFSSAAQAFGDEVLAVVLTGMGEDGLAGARSITAAGGEVIVQDEATSVVWGMPGQVARAGLAAEVLPLEDIAGKIVAAVSRGCAPAAARGPAVGASPGSTTHTNRPSSQTTSTRPAPVVAGGRR